MNDFDLREIMGKIKEVGKELIDYYLKQVQENRFKKIKEKEDQSYNNRDFKSSYTKWKEAIKK